MFILIVAATSDEVNTTIAWLKDSGGKIAGNETEVLITGVGGTATAYALTGKLNSRRPDVVIQAGICGSFSQLYPPLTTVVVREDVFADLGVFSDQGFDDIFDLGLAAADTSPYDDKWLVNKNLGRWREISYPFVRGATVNCISSTQGQINAIIRKYKADVESMEGAAFHYTCILEDVPFFQLRTISNFVGERDKSKWLLKESITELNSKLKESLLLL